jgi:hypothetical protein
LLDKFLTTWLCANSIFGHPNSFAILTTGEKMWIAWMNIGNSNRITDKQNRLSNTELNQLMSRLPCKSVDIRNLSTSGLDSGSSWSDGVNGILMQQEPNLPKQDYWNQRAIASLANTLITVVEPVSMPLLSSMLLLQL